MKRKKVVIAGASGFVGQNLIENLSKQDIEIIALSRSLRKSSHENVKWVQCDCFSSLDLENAMEGADEAIYLIHSMQPTAKLDQASFMDYDLIIADNFARTAKKLNINRMIYLSGIVPSKTVLSSHLESRLEVEKVFEQYFDQYIFLRVGLILGPYGSSFNILKKLIQRLPVLICPGWAKNKMSPVTIDVVIDVIVSALNSKELKSDAYDIGSKDNISYLALMKETSNVLNLKRIFIPIKFNFNFLSRLWVSKITGAPTQLVYPLIESLNHDMSPNRSHFFPFQENLSVKEGLKRTFAKEQVSYNFKTRPIKRNTARSVQRFLLPKSCSSDDIVNDYMDFFTSFFLSFYKSFYRKEKYNPIFVYS